ncbi:MAG TPA: ABC transporter ATP-binding protein [Candidatus Saccharimonadales bacterium]|nr:ABC transporter ATP-binding protein [Candidatus Saccharimonadales bacterium]
MSEEAIKVSGVYKDFILPHEKKDSVKRIFTSLFKQKDGGAEVQHALHDISFSVKKGEFFGIVGRNGSGKSTLLKMLAGIYQPTKGRVDVDGKLVPFIELGVGFNPELTGRENVYLNGALLGFSRKEITERYDDIVKFAELERFMDQKLKNYSSGMQVRLAFSVAIKAEADILLVDEVLAVGDASFQRKCFEYFRLLKKNKKTVVFVTHDMNAVREYCDRAMLIEKSKIVSIDKPSRIATQYTRLFNPSRNGEKKEQKKSRWGNEDIQFENVSVTPSQLHLNEEKIVIKVDAVAVAPVENPVFGFSIQNRDGNIVTGTNSQIKQLMIPQMKAGDRVTVTWKLDNVFNDDLYSVGLAATLDDGATVCDWWEEAAEFEVVNEERVPYVINPPVDLQVTGVKVEDQRN